MLPRPLQLHYIAALFDLGKRSYAFLRFLKSLLLSLISGMTRMISPYPAYNTTWTKRIDTKRHEEFSMENFFFIIEANESKRNWRRGTGKATRSPLLDRSVVATLSCGLAAGFLLHLYLEGLGIGYPLSRAQRNTGGSWIRVIKVHETRDHRPLYRSPRPIYFDHTLDPPGTRICGFFTASSLH